MSGELDKLFGQQPQPEAEPDQGPGRWRRRTRRLVMVGLVLVTAGAVTGLAGAYVVGAHFSSNVRRVTGAFDGIDPSTRPSTNPASPSQTVLAVGLDARSPDQTTGEAATAAQAYLGGDRSDTIMLIRFDPAKQSASTVSIPRDSWVSIPGKGTMKINAAYALGGPPLLISTVEQLTGVRVDHFMVVDFAGFRSVVDAVGGVEVQVAATTAAGATQFQEGANHLDGTQALAYVRQRYGLPEGDLDRIRRQQNLLRAVLTKVAVTNPTGDPLRTYEVLDTVTKAVTVDDGYTEGELRGLALDAARLRTGDVWFLTAPVSGTGWEGDQSVVYLDTTRSAELWQALRAGTMSEYVDAHRDSLLPEVPR